MISRILLVAVCAGLMAGVFAADAQAKKGFHWPFFDSIFNTDREPEYPAWRSNRHIEYPDGLTAEEYDRIYGNKFDKKFYEPDYQPPVRKTAIPAVGSAAAKSTTAATAASKSAAVSCDKASSIITGYGFSDVKPADCLGQVYAFSAARDGKAYAIKLNAASGELTEVKKVQ